MIQPELLEELSDFQRASQTDSTGFLCLYGSGTYHPDKLSSDVDLFIVGDPKQSRDPAAISEVVSFVRDFHVRYNRRIDEEVPFENKVIYSQADIDAATSLAGFRVAEDTGSLVIPPLEKSTEFLTSREMKLRLALNALTTPHVAIGADLSRYTCHKQAAELAITLTGISQRDDPNFCPGDVYEALTVGPDGNVGEMHLGYKTEHPLVHDHLLEVIDRSVTTLVKADVVRRHGPVFDRPSQFPVAAIVQHMKSEYIK